MKIKKITYAIAITTALLTMGCLPAFSPSTNNDQTFRQMKKNDFAIEIKKLTKIVKSPQVSDQEKAEAHRRLAIIYLIPRNPQQDQKKALNELGKFLEMAPGELNQTSAASWATAIKSAGEYKELERKAKKLGSENRKLTEANRNLAASNARLEADIEKLKNLDLSLEKKRKSFR